MKKLHKAAMTFPVEPRPAMTQCNNFSSEEGKSNYFIDRMAAVFLTNNPPLQIFPWHDQITR
jgi:hypothetical protein